MNHYKNKKGVVLPYVLIVGAFLMILAAGLFLVAGTTSGLFNKSYHDRQAYLNAKSAVEYARAYLYTAEDVPTDFKVIATLDKNNRATNFEVSEGVATEDELGNPDNNDIAPLANCVVKPLETPDTYEVSVNGKCVSFNGDNPTNDYEYLNYHSTLTAAGKVDSDVNKTTSERMTIKNPLLTPNLPTEQPVGTVTPGTAGSPISMPTSAEECPWPQKTFSWPSFPTEDIAKIPDSFDDDNQEQSAESSYNSHPNLVTGQKNLELTNINYYQQIKTQLLFSATENLLVQNVTVDTVTKPDNQAMEFPVVLQAPNVFVAGDLSLVGSSALPLNIKIIADTVVFSKTVSLADYSTLVIEPFTPGVTPMISFAGGNPSIGSNSSITSNGNTVTSSVTPPLTVKISARNNPNWIAQVNASRSPAITVTDAAVVNAGDHTLTADHIHFTGSLNLNANAKLTIKPKTAGIKQSCVVFEDRSTVNMQRATLDIQASYTDFKGINTNISASTIQVAPAPQQDSNTVRAFYTMMNNKSNFNIMATYADVGILTLNDSKTTVTANGQENTVVGNAISLTRGILEVQSSFAKLNTLTLSGIFGAEAFCSLTPNPSGTENAVFFDKTVSVASNSELSIEATHTEFTDNLTNESGEVNVAPNPQTGANTLLLKKGLMLTSGWGKVQFDCSYTQIDGNVYSAGTGQNDIVFTSQFAENNTVYINGNLTLITNDQFKIEANYTRFNSTMTPNGSAKIIVLPSASNNNRNDVYFIGKVTTQNGTSFDIQSSYTYIDKEFLSVPTSFLNIATASFGPNTKITDPANKDNAVIFNDVLDFTSTSLDGSSAKEIKSVTVTATYTAFHKTVNVVNMQPKQAMTFYQFLGNTVPNRASVLYFYDDVSLAERCTVNISVDKVEFKGDLNYNKQSNVNIYPHEYDFEAKKDKGTARVNNVFFNNVLIPQSSTNTSTTIIADYTDFTGNPYYFNANSPLTDPSKNKPLIDNKMEVFASNTTMKFLPHDTAALTEGKTQRINTVYFGNMKLAPKENSSEKITFDITSDFIVYKGTYENLGKNSPLIVRAVSDFNTIFDAEKSFIHKAGDIRICSEKNPNGSFFSAKAIRFQGETEISPATTSVFSARSQYYLINGDLTLGGALGNHQDENGGYMLDWKTITPPTAEGELPVKESIVSFGNIFFDNESATGAVNTLNFEDLKFLTLRGNIDRGIIFSHSTATPPLYVYVNPFTGDTISLLDGDGLLKRGYYQVTKESDILQSLLSHAIVKEPKDYPKPPLIPYEYEKFKPDGTPVDPDDTWGDTTPGDTPEGELVFPSMPAFEATSWDEFNLSELNSTTIGQINASQKRNLKITSDSDLIPVRDGSFTIGNVSKDDAGNDILDLDCVVIDKTLAHDFRAYLTINAKQIFVMDTANAESGFSEMKLNAQYVYFKAMNSNNLPVTVNIWNNHPNAIPTCGMVVNGDAIYRNPLTVTTKSTSPGAYIHFRGRLLPNNSAAVVTKFDILGSYLRVDGESSFTNSPLDITASYVEFLRKFNLATGSEIMIHNATVASFNEIYYAGARSLSISAENIIFKGNINKRVDASANYKLFLTGNGTLPPKVQFTKTTDRCIVKPGEVPYVTYPAGWYTYPYGESVNWLQQTTLLAETTPGENLPPFPSIGDGAITITEEVYTKS